MADERIGVVGPGRMGLAMVKHLIAKGYDVAVTDISPEQVAKAEALGATGRANAADLGKDRSIVIIAVGFDEETIDATLGKNGLLETMQPGTVIAISSTSSPDTVRMIATKAAGQSFIHVQSHHQAGRFPRMHPFSLENLLRVTGHVMIPMARCF